MSAAPAFVFLHGGQHGSWCWGRLIEQLAPSSRATLGLDVPGCGLKRGQDTSAQTLASVATALNAEIRAAGLGPVVLVGHSMAGALLPLMAALDPALFCHLAYLAACLPRPGDSVLATLGQTVRGLDPAVVGWPLDPLSTPPLAMLQAMFGPGLDAATLQWLLAEAVQDQWPLQLAAEPVALHPAVLPATYVVTLQDPILPVAWQGRFAERAGAGAMPMLDAPHEAFLTHPAALAALLLALPARPPPGTG